MFVSLLEFELSLFGVAWTGNWKSYNSETFANTDSGFFPILRLSIKIIKISYLYSSFSISDEIKERTKNTFNRRIISISNSYYSTFSLFVDVVVLMHFWKKETLIQKNRKPNFFREERKFRNFAEKRRSGSEAKRKWETAFFKQSATKNFGVREIFFGGGIFDDTCWKYWKL